MNIDTRVNSTLVFFKPVKLGNWRLLFHGNGTDGQKIIFFGQPARINNLAEIQTKRLGGGWVVCWELGGERSVAGRWLKNKHIIGAAEKHTIMQL